MIMLRLLALILFLLPGLATAQGAPRTIIVLDGSGSMWGQIDGVNKIVIAREVMADLLATLPAEQELGLMSYGHRRKGDCADIELLIEPGTDREAIAEAVNAINPKGKTPLSAAVIQAAEALRYTEESATVILVSDGIETCNLDPCAVGRELETAGVGFTAHVIGFDVAEPEALAQLQCLAEETGGMFRTAGNADELAQALDVVVAAPEPEPEPEIIPAPVTFRAIAGENGPEITEGLVWNIATDAAGPVAVNDMAPNPLLDILPGDGRAEVLRVSDEATAEARFTVVDDAAMTVTLVLSENLPDASLDAAASAPAGAELVVRWTGPGAERDYIAVASPNMGRSEWHEYIYVADGDDQAVRLQMPPDPGAYELRYIHSEGGKVLATRPVEVTPIEVRLTAPENPVIGLVAPVPWVGPDYPRDYIAVASPGSDDGQYETYAYTEAGNPAGVTMPATPGDYELRYVLGDSGRVVARLPITVADAATSVSGPAEAPAGATITVDWSGPDAQNDYISIAEAGGDDRRYEGYTYTKSGNPVRLRLPMTPGDYELRYVMSQDSTVLARAPITLTPVAASLDGPAEAAAGSQLSVGWSGPDYGSDYISIAEVGADDGSYEAYAYTGNGNPARFDAPTAPGAYELRYVANDNGKAVIARAPITITEVTATLAAPASAASASTLAVGWTGPGGDRDLITIARPDDGDRQHETYAYVREGDPVQIRVPTLPGDYEVRYQLDGADKRVIARQPLTVTAVSARLDAPASGPAGAEVAVAFEGPSYDDDLITIARPGERPRDYESYGYVRNGSPVTLALPDTPGDYELRYLVRGTDPTVIARQPLTVTAP
jgi:Ca-activated chloride channel homolog